MRINLKKLRSMGYEVEVNEKADEIIMYRKNSTLEPLVSRALDVFQTEYDLSGMEHDMLFSTICTKLEQFDLMKAVN